MLNRLQLAVISVMSLMVLGMIGMMIVTGKVLMDGLGRNPTIFAITNIRRAWRQGDVMEIGHRVFIGTRTAIEGGVRWQVASYYLTRTDQLLNDGQTNEAVDACLAASYALDAFDDGNDVYEDCVDLYWEQRGW
jgi:hypothetical protein